MAEKMGRDKFRSRSGETSVRSLTSSATSRTLLVGLGSPHGDDQAGWLVASELQRRLAGQPDVVEQRNRDYVAVTAPRDEPNASPPLRPDHALSCLERSAHHAERDGDVLACRLAKSPSDLLDWLDDVTRLIVCDCCESPAQLGELRLWHWPADRFVRTRSSSSHQLGLPDVLDLATNIGRLPRRVELWAIGGGRFSPETQPSSLVREACQRLALQLWEGFASA